MARQMNINAAMTTIQGVIEEFVHEQGTIEHVNRGRVERSIGADLADRLKPSFQMDQITVDSHYNKHLNAAGSY